MKTKTCPRCGCQFTCNHDDIAQCQCATIHLTPQAQQYITNHYTDCLCAQCLQAINQTNPAINQTTHK